MKDRRYGTHFNYDTHNYQDVCAKSSPSLVTTPSGTYNSSGSDTSSLPDFDFPEPPPLRRMQSSPFFSLDDTISPLANLLENALEMSVHLPSSSVSELVSVGAHEKGLERQGEAILRQDALREREKKLLRSSQSRLRAASSPNLHDAGASNFVTTFPPLPALPAHNTEPRKLTKMRSLRFASDCNTSSDRLDVRIRPAAMPARPKTTHTLHKGRSLSMEYLTKRISRSTPFTPSSRPTGHPQMLKAQAFRGPYPHTSFSPSHSSHVNHLGTPFLHRSMPAAPRPIPIDSPDSFASQRSFMDFSPDRDVRTRRTTFRRLMSRASMLIGWKSRR